MSARQTMLTWPLLLCGCDALWGGLRSDNEASCVIAASVCSADEQCDPQLGMCQPKPVITAVTPARVPSGGGVAITITGENFLPGAVAALGGIPLSNAVVQPTRIAGTMQAEPGCRGSLAVSVTSTDGKEATRSDLMICFSNTPQFQTSSLTVGAGPSGLAVGDINGDKKDDLAVANSSDGTVSVLLSKSGGLGPAASFGAGTGPATVAVGDLNNDGRADVISADYGSSTLSVLLADAAGALQPRQTINNISTPDYVALADFDRDGQLDFVTANRYSDTLSVGQGNGNGTFQKAGSLSCGTSLGPDVVAVADFTGDGKLDIVSGNIKAGNLCIHTGLGNGNFRAGNTLSLPGGTVPQGLAAGDINGDGKVDLVVASRDGAAVLVLLGNGDGTFRQGATYPVAAQPYSVALGDLNGDQHLDVAVAARGAGSVSVLLGVGDGTFQGRQDFPVGVQPTSVAFGDLNADGKPDLAVANSGSGTVTVLFNDFK